MFQMIEIVTSKSEKITQACDNMAQRGTLIRAGYSLSDYAIVGMIIVMAIVALVLIAGLVWLAAIERAEKRAMANTVPYVYARGQTSTIVDFADLNTRN